MSAVASNISFATAAGPDNGISKEMLGRLKASYGKDGGNKAVRNALAGNSIDVLAVNAENIGKFDNNFSHRVKSKGITDQKRSGRCWLFTGLNVLRSQMMAKNDLPELKLSHNYNFFYDQLEKANLFLQGMIDNAAKPEDDKMVEWLMRNPLSDGGQFTGIADNISKYGVVPDRVMPESFSAENTSRMNNLLSLKLREDGLELRKMAKDGKNTKAIAERKEQMLADVYRILALTLGEPPTEFTWTRRNSKGDAVSTKTYTPLEFYKEYAGNDLKNGYVMLMNDPTREYYKLYEIDFDRHSYDGDNWTYINLPVDEIKEMAIKSIKDSTMMYFSCDVNKFLDRKNGVADPANFESVRRLFPGREITVVFQPHLYTRTRDFAPDFADALGGCDRLVMPEIYPARELPIPGVSSLTILDAVNGPEKTYCERKDLLNLIKNSNFDVLMTLGAADIDRLLPDISGILKEKKASKHNG